MNEESLEQEIQNKGLNAPRLSPTMISDTIVGEQYFKLTDVLTVCILTLKNGFTVTGESVCASPENYDKEIGEKIAREVAKNKIWPLEGYLLKQRISDGFYLKATNTARDRVKEELSQNVTRLNDLIQFEKNGSFRNLSSDTQVQLYKQIDIMKSYSQILVERLDSWKG